MFLDFVRERSTISPRIGTYRYRKSVESQKFALKVTIILAVLEFLTVWKFHPVKLADLVHSTFVKE